MLRSTIALPVALLFALTMTAHAQQKPVAKKTPLPAIDIKLGDDDDYKPVPSSTNASAPVTSAPHTVQDVEKKLDAAKAQDARQNEAPLQTQTKPQNQAAPQAQVALETDDDSSTKAAVKQAISKMLEQKTQELKPGLVSWSKASEELQKFSGGITPDFTSPGDLQERIKMYQNLKIESEKLADNVANIFQTMPDDLRKLGVPNENISEVNNAILADPERLMQRMRIGAEMCGMAVQALTILKTEWGNWNYTKEKGIQFLSKFNPASRLQYSNAVAKYQQDAEDIQKYGSAK